MNSYRLSVCDHYLSPPIRGLDVTHSEFRGSDVRQVPIIRIFGPSKDGKKSCLHVHGVFPYLFVPYEGSESPDKLKYLLAMSLDKTINVSLGQTNSLIQHVYKITLVSGTPFYGYHKNEHQFFKIYFYNPNLVKRAAELLQNGSIMNTVYQPHEAHIPFQLQFMMDFNLQGMNFVHCRKVLTRMSAGDSDWEVDLFSDSRTVPVKAPLRVSTCEVEVDVMAVDIINRENISDGGVNPGLASLWEDECERRRGQGRQTQPTPQTSQTRSAITNPGEELFRTALLEKLQQLSQNVLSMSSSGDSVPYPAEAPHGMLNASFVDPHTPLRTSHRPNLDISEPSTSTSLMDTQDAELLDVLYELAETQEEEDEKDVVLGSQEATQRSRDQQEQEDLETLEMSQPFLSLPDTSSDNIVIKSSPDRTIKSSPHFTPPYLDNSQSPKYQPLPGTSFKTEISPSKIAKISSSPRPATSCDNSDNELVESSPYRSVKISSPLFINVSESDQITSLSLEPFPGTRSDSSDNELIESSPNRTIKISPPCTPPFFNNSESPNPHVQDSQVSTSESLVLNSSQNQNSTSFLSQNTIDLKELMSQSENCDKNSLLVSLIVDANNKKQEPTTQDSTNIRDSDSDLEDFSLAVSNSNNSDQNIQDSDNSTSQTQQSERPRSEEILRAEDEELMGLLDQIPQLDGTDDDSAPQKGRRLGIRGRYIPIPPQPPPTDSLSGTDFQTDVQSCSISSTISSPSQHNSDLNLLMEVIGSEDENTQNVPSQNFQILPSQTNTQSQNPGGSEQNDTLILSQTESFEFAHNSSTPKLRKDKILEYLQSDPDPLPFLYLLKEANIETPSASNALEIGLNTEPIVSETLETNVEHNVSEALVMMSNSESTVTNALEVHNANQTIPETLPSKRIISEMLATETNTEPQTASDALITGLCNTLTWSEGECDSFLNTCRELELSEGRAAMSLLEEEGFVDQQTLPEGLFSTETIATKNNNNKRSLRSRYSTKRINYYPVSSPSNCSRTSQESRFPNPHRPEASDLNGPIPNICVTTQSKDDYDTVVKLVPQDSQLQSQATLTSVYSKNRKRKRKSTSPTTRKPKMQILNMQLEIPNNKKSVICMELDPQSTSSKKMKITFCVEDALSDATSYESMSGPVNTRLMKNCSVALKRLTSQEIQFYTQRASTPSVDEQVTFSSSLLPEKDRCAIVIRKSRPKRKPRNNHWNSRSHKRSHKKKKKSATNVLENKEKASEKEQKIFNSNTSPVFSNSFSSSNSFGSQNSFGSPNSFSASNSFCSSNSFSSSNSSHRSLKSERVVAPTNEIDVSTSTSKICESSSDLSENIASPEDFMHLRRGRAIRRVSDDSSEVASQTSVQNKSQKTYKENPRAQIELDRGNTPNSESAEDQGMNSSQEIPNSQESGDYAQNSAAIAQNGTNLSAALSHIATSSKDSGGDKRGRCKRKLIQEEYSENDLSSIEFLESSQTYVQTESTKTTGNTLQISNTENIISETDSNSECEIVENSEEESDIFKCTQRSQILNNTSKSEIDSQTQMETQNATQKRRTLIFKSLNTSGDTWEAKEISVKDLKRSPLYQHIESQPSKNYVGPLKKDPDKLPSIVEEQEDDQEGIVSFYDLNETTVVENMSYFEPKESSPSLQQVLDSLNKHNLHEVIAKEPYYSVSSDVTNKTKEIGGRIRKLTSTAVKDLPLFQSKFSYQKPVQTSFVQLQNWIFIEPLLAAPTAKQVLHYSKPENSRKHNCSKLKIFIPKSPDHDSDGDDRSMTLSPCSDTGSAPITPVSQHKTPKAHSTPMPKALARCMTPRRTSTQSDSWCKIDGPSPLNNTFGFRVPSANLQNARALVQPQHLSVLAVEAQVSTRGDLMADPDIDPVRAVFYLASCDNGQGTSELGVIAVAQPGEAPMLPGLKRPVIMKTVTTEKCLMEELVQLVKKWDPDILVGYQTEKASWGYIIQRGAQLEMNLVNLLSRVPKPDSSYPSAPVRQPLSQGALTEFSEVRITGRILLNLWRLLRNEVALQSYVFENIAFHVLHERVPAHSARTLTFWWEHPSGLHRWKVIDHWVRRIHGSSRIMDQLDLIGRNAELAKLFGIQFYEVISRGSQFRVESMMLRLAKPRNFVPVSPSVMQRAHMKAPECVPLILEPESMYYADPVIVLDFQSLYPSIIIAYNYCFSTCLGRVEHLGQDGAFQFGCTHLKVPPPLLGKLTPKLNVSPCGVAFVPKNVREGVLPCMLREILDTRLMVKKSMKENKGDATLQRVLHARQLGLKLIANVTYGYTAANFSGRMPCIEVGDSVVSKGRETLDRAIRMVQERSSEWGGARVVYGDTDSMFVLVPGKSRKQAFEIGALIAEAVTQANPSPVKLKLEKVYQPCILQTKKRYVGFMYESGDQEMPVYEAKGIETVRRDGCPAVAKMLEKTLRILFETQDVSLVKKYVTNQFQKILLGRTNLQDLVFAKEFRGFSGYKPGACVPALELARQWVRVDKRAEPLQSERVPYVVVSGAPGLPLIRLVRCPHEVLRDPALRPNFEYYITRAIAPALDRCLSLIGADVMTWYAEMPRRTCHSLPTVNCTAGKATISQYFATIECAACKQHQTREGLCENCRMNPQSAALTLVSKVRKWERAVANIYKLCTNCCSHPTPNECSSLVCPIMFRRVQANRDLQQAPFVRQLLTKFFDF